MISRREKGRSGGRSSDWGSLRLLWLLVIDRMDLYIYVFLQVLTDSASVESSCPVLSPLPTSTSLPLLMWRAKPKKKPKDTTNDDSPIQRTLNRSITRARGKPRTTGGARAGEPRNRASVGGRKEDEWSWFDQH